MDVQKIEIEVPRDIMAAMHISGEELIKQMKTLTAIHLYLSRELSLEMAGQFAEKSKLEFEDLLSKNKVPISLIDFDDYQKELDIISNL